MKLPLFFKRRFWWWLISACVLLLSAFLAERQKETKSHNPGSIVSAAQVNFRLGEEKMEKLLSQIEQPIHKNSWNAKRINDMITP